MTSSLFSHARCVSEPMGVIVWDASVQVKQFETSQPPPMCFSMSFLARVRWPTSSRHGGAQRWGSATASRTVSEKKATRKEGATNRYSYSSIRNIRLVAPLGGPLEQPGSAAAAALRASKLRETRSTAAVCGSASRISRSPHALYVGEHVIDDSPLILDAEVRVPDTDEFVLAGMVGLVEGRGVGLRHQPTAPLGGCPDPLGHAAEDGRVNVFHVEEHDNPAGSQGESVQEHAEDGNAQVIPLPPRVSEDGVGQFANTLEQGISRHQTLHRRTNKISCPACLGGLRSPGKQPGGPDSL